MDGQLLGGGNMNAVVRVGKTVVRRAGPWTPTVHQLLDHLRERGFDAAAVPLGSTGDQEILTYLTGTVPHYPMPAWVWSEPVLAETAALLRRWHDASLGFDVEGAVWQQPARKPAEVICHNDFSPHNLVFVDGQVTGVIDVDMASPGPRVRDLASLATRLVPLSQDHPAWESFAHARRRLRTLLAAYDWRGTGAEVLDAAEESLLDLAAFSDRKADELARPDLREHAAGYRADAQWIAAELRPGLRLDEAAPAPVREMTEEEFDDWRASQVESYTAELLEAGAHGSLDEARERSATQLADLLPNGRMTEGMRLMRVLDDDGHAVGVLWVGPHPRRDDAGWVYDVEIDADRRGSGLGRRAMLAAEDLCRESGWTEVGLNVFGPNARARALYDSLGYRVVNTNLSKPLSGGLPPVAR